MARSLMDVEYTQGCVMFPLGPQLGISEASSFFERGQNQF
jgi:hypothetical protein